MDNRRMFISLDTALKETIKIWLKGRKSRIKQNKWKPKERISKDKSRVEGDRDHNLKIRAKSGDLNQDWVNEEIIYNLIKKKIQI